MGEPLNIKTIRDKMLEAMEDPNVNTRDMATVFRRFNTKAGECKNAPAARCTLDKFVSKAMAPADYPKYGDDYDRLLAIQEGRAAEAFPAVAAAPEPAPEAAPEAAPEPAPSEEQETVVERSGPAGPKASAEAGTEGEDILTFIKSNFGGHVSFGFVGPTGFEAPGDIDPESSSWPVAPQVAVDLGWRRFGFPLGLFFHFDGALVRTTTMKSSSYDSTEQRENDRTAHENVLIVRPGAQLRVYTPTADFILEGGAVHTGASDIHQGYLRETSIDNWTKYIAAGGAWRPGGGAFEVGGKLYLEGNLGLTKWDETGTSNRHSNFGSWAVTDSGSFNLKLGVFAGARF